MRNGRAVRNVLVALTLVAVGVIGAVFFMSRGSAIVVANKPVELVYFKTLPGERGQTNILFTVAGAIRGTNLRGTILVPKPYTVIDRSLRINTLVYSVSKYEGRKLAVVRYNPRVIVAARGGTRIAPDPSMNIAQRVTR